MPAEAARHDVEISLSRAASLSEAKPSLAARIAALKAYLMMCAETCADYYAAAAAYDQLSGLSDAELSRRGLAATPSPATSRRPATARTADARPRRAQ